uniref:Uncharacterized protein n=1 Tax=Chromera velia CCMP2878 TaxID=1169474 RepID=A0A0G4FKI0_9ALVE|eukprot:Cvel_427.t1-p1 / transcript=Cvel_427.t1 / gene=Cvel_427 / organism=Chromera_velia_CCMP2878 / gene_product=hypothetical protein / transcript_product=hypothetical protein / location=Cvel_scaffold13:231428-234612(+) / protein_length=596 / sequence_SO=supercontig / SO=protein_coding / is_pseudo=false
MRSLVADGGGEGRTGGLEASDLCSPAKTMAAMAMCCFDLWGLLILWWALMTWRGRRTLGMVTTQLQKLLCFPVTLHSIVMLCQFALFLQCPNFSGEEGKPAMVYRLTRITLSTLAATVSFAILSLLSRGLFVSRFQLSRKQGVTAATLIVAVYMLESSDNFRIIPWRQLMLWIRVAAYTGLCGHLLFVCRRTYLFLRTRLLFSSVTRLTRFQPALAAKTAMIRDLGVAIVVWYFLDVCLGTFLFSALKVQGSPSPLPSYLDPSSIEQLEDSPLGFGLRGIANVVLWSSVIIIFRPRPHIPYFSLVQYNEPVVPLVPLYSASVVGGPAPDPETGHDRTSRGSAGGTEPQTYTARALIQSIIRTGCLPPSPPLPLVVIVNPPFPKPDSVREKRKASDEQGDSEEPPGPSEDRLRQSLFSPEENGGGAERPEARREEGEKHDEENPPDRPTRQADRLLNVPPNAATSASAGILRGSFSDSVASFGPGGGTYSICLGQPVFPLPPRPSTAVQTSRDHAQAERGDHPGSGGGRLVAPLDPDEDVPSPAESDEEKEEEAAVAPEAARGASNLRPGRGGEELAGPREDTFFTPISSSRQLEQQ